VPAALETLARLAPDQGGWDEARDERWHEAMAVLDGHVCHQGDVYEVTPRAVPFVVELVEYHRNYQLDELVEYLARLAIATNRYARSDDPDSRALAERLDTALTGESGAILDWFDGGLAEARTGVEVGDNFQRTTTYLVVFTPGLRTRGYERLRERDALPFYVYAAAAEIDEHPDWLLERAVADTNADEELERLAAAAFIARTGDHGARLRAGTDELLGPTTAGKLERALPLLGRPAIPGLR
jgi:hypothetical protein